jgi:hypothetical protein
MSIPSIFSDNVANIPDKLGKINGRWTAVITKATGQAGPYIFVYRRLTPSVSVIGIGNRGLGPNNRI